MRSVVAITIFAFVAQVHAIEYVPDTNMDSLINNLAVSVFDEVRIPTMKVFIPHDDDLDDTTLGISVPAIRSPFPSPSSSITASRRAGGFATPWTGNRPQCPAVTTQAKYVRIEGYDLKQNMVVRQKKQSVRRGRTPIPVPQDSYTKVLEMVGTGYRASMKGDTISLNCGFCHEVEVKPWKDCKYEVDKKGTTITVTGPDKMDVGQAAQRLKYVKPPEPYGGKGIRYQGEVIVLKPGKSGKAK